MTAKQELCSVELQHPKDKSLFESGKQSKSLSLEIENQMENRPEPKTDS